MGISYILILLRQTGREKCPGALLGRLRLDRIEYGHADGQGAATLLEIACQLRPYHAGAGRIDDDFRATGASRSQ